MGGIGAVSRTHPSEGQSGGGRRCTPAAAGAYPTMAGRPRDPIILADLGRGVLKLGTRRPDAGRVEERPPEALARVHPARRLLRPIRVSARGLAALLALSWLVGCAKPEVGYDLDPEAPIGVYHSFGILEAKPREEVPEDPRMGPLLDRHTEDAIDAALRLRGYQLRTSGPVDFLVAYSNEIQREQRTVGSPVSLGVGYGSTVGSGIGIGTGWYGPTHATTRTLAKGTLVIDVLEPETHRVVWRGWAKDTLTASGDPRGEIFEVVSRILEQFPQASPR